MNKNMSGLANINGTQIFYEMKGEGRPLVLVHGQPLDSRMWDAQFEEFSKHFLTIRFDMAGYGKSGVHDSDFSYLEDMKNLLEYLEIDSVYLLGLSVGGMLCMDFTLAYPNMVEKLILVSTGLLGWTEFSLERQEFNKELNELYQKGDQEKIIQLMSNKWVAGPFRSTDEVMPHVIKEFSEMARNSFAKEKGQGKLILSESKTIDLIEKLSVPTLIISPEVDFPEFTEISKFLNENIKESQLVVVPGTAHMINMEKPTDFNKLVHGFLK